MTPPLLYGPKREWQGHNPVTVTERVKIRNEHTKVGCWWELETKLWSTMPEYSTLKPGGGGGGMKNKNKSAYFQN